jgi:hypothetical protein
MRQLYTVILVFLLTSVVLTVHSPVWPCSWPLWFYRPQSGLALILASIDSAVYSPFVLALLLASVIVTVHSPVWPCSWPTWIKIQRPVQRSVSPSVSPSFSQDIEANSPPYYDLSCGSANTLLPPR